MSRIIDRTDSHYRENHAGRPHEYYINRAIPTLQQQSSEMKPAGYVILYLFLAFVVFLILMAFIMWLVERRRAARTSLGDASDSVERKQDKEKSLKGFHNFSGREDSELYRQNSRDNGNLYPNPEIEEKGSLFEGSVVTTTTTEIQPKAPPMSCEKIDEMSRKSSSFGLMMMNIHHQQRQNASIASSTEFGMHNSSATHQFPGPPLSSSSSPATGNASSSSASLADNRKRMSKMESFPYEEFGMPVEERQPIKTRVQDLKTYDTYFHLTPVDADLLREDSIAEDDNYSGGSGNDEEADRRTGRFESRSTLPRSSIDRSGSAS